MSVMESPRKDGLTVHVNVVGRPEAARGTADSKTNGHAPERNLTREDLEGALGQARRSEAMLREFVDTIPTLAWCALPDGSNGFVNQRWQDFTGLTTQEAHGWGWRAAIHPEDWPKLLNRWSTLLAAGVSGEMQARLRLRFCCQQDSVSNAPKAMGHFLECWKVKENR
jgi:PAS domain-containing protein